MPFLSRLARFVRRFPPLLSSSSTAISSHSLIQPSIRSSLTRRAIDLIKSECGIPPKWYSTHYPSRRASEVGCNHATVPSAGWQDPAGPDSAIRNDELTLLLCPNGDRRFEPVAWTDALPAEDRDPLLGRNANLARLVDLLRTRAIVDALLQRLNSAQETPDASLAPAVPVTIATGHPGHARSDRGDLRDARSSYQARRPASPGLAPRPHHRRRRGPRPLRLVRRQPRRLQQPCRRCRSRSRRPRART